MIKQNLQTLISEGVELQLEGKFNEAESKYRKALKAEPANAVVHNNLGFSYTQRKMFKEAIEEYDKAISLDNNNYTAYKNLGITFMMMNRLEDAENVLSIACSLNENDENVYDNIAQLSFIKEDWNKAEIFWKRSYELLPGIEKLISIAQVLIKQNKLDEAINVLNMVFESDKENTPAYYLSGVINFMSGNFGAALKYFRIALGIEPENTETRHYLAMTMLKMGKNNEAAAELERIVMLKPGHTEALNNLAVMYLSEGKIQNALACLNKTLGVDKLNAKALYYKGAILVQSKDKSEGIACLKNVVKMGETEYLLKSNEILTAIKKGKNN